MRGCCSIILVAKWTVYLTLTTITIKKLTIKIGGSRQSLSLICMLIRIHLITSRLISYKSSKRLLLIKVRIIIKKKRTILVPKLNNLKYHLLLALFLVGATRRNPTDKILSLLINWNKSKSKQKLIINNNSHMRQCRI